MRNPELAPLLHRRTAAAALTLASSEGIDFKRQAEDPADRFANQAIAHKTYQIAADGAENRRVRAAAGRFR